MPPVNTSEKQEMSRNQDIQKIFEIADDSLQGVLGYHFYVTSVQQSADTRRVEELLPDRWIPLTHSWGRFYDKSNLVKTMESIFESYQSRISLMAMVNVFEVALGNLIYHLDGCGHPQFLSGRRLDGRNDNYKTCIRWAYVEAERCDIGDTEAMSRIPTTFGNIDNARRLRNLIVHNHGLFTQHYEQDAIVTFEVKLHPDYDVFRREELPTPLRLASADVIEFSKSHIEALHILHNGIQKNLFGGLESYDYGDEQKGIEWNKVLIGI